MSRTDEELMTAWCGGERAAFDALFARWAPILLGMMLRDVRKRQDAEELVQDAFLNLHRARRDFRPGARLRPWLVTIALNLKREYFRRKGRRPEAPLELDGRTDPSHTPRLDEEQHAARQIQRALRSLPDDQREVIELHWFAQLSFPEVAEVVGASLSAVKVRAHRGYKRMRATLDTGEV